MSYLSLLTSYLTQIFHDSLKQWLINRLKMLPFHNALAHNLSHTHRERKRKKYPFFSFCLHLNAEEVAQLNLCNVVADKLVVLEVCTIHIGVAWLLGNIGLLMN
jgi:hypothetical protein